MTKAAALRVVSYAVTFAAGAMAGALVAVVRTAAPSAELLSLMTSAKEAEGAYVAYRYGSYPAAREALLKYVHLMEMQQPQLLGQAGHSFELMLAYGRLGVAAEKAGESADVGMWLRRATEVKHPDGRILTEGDIRNAVARLDAAWDRRLGRAASSAGGVPENNEMQRTKPAQAMELRR